MKKNMSQKTPLTEIEKFNEKALKEVIASVKVSREKIKYNKPKLVKSIKIPKSPKTLKISKLISFSNIEIPYRNIIKYDPLSFTGWVTFERFLKEQYDIAIINELFLTSENELSIELNSGNKIGYLIVTKEDAFKLNGGGFRLTHMILKKVKDTVENELKGINLKIKTSLEKV